MFLEIILEGLLWMLSIAGGFCTLVTLGFALNRKVITKDESLYLLIFFLISTTICIVPLYFLIPK